MPEPYGLDLDTRIRVNTTERACAKVTQQLLAHEGPLASFNIERLTDLQSSAETLVETIKWLLAQQPN